MRAAKHLGGPWLLACTGLTSRAESKHHHEEKVEMSRFLAQLRGQSLCEGRGSLWPLPAGSHIKQRSRHAEQGLKRGSF